MTAAPGALRSPGIPLEFEPSARQDGFVARGSGFAVRVDASGATYQFQQGPGQHSRVHMKLVGRSPDAKPAGAAPVAGRSNYFLGNQPQAWRPNVPHFARVEERGVYPGVDVVYYARGGNLEHDFVLAPGADPSSIRMQFEGVKKLRLDSNGDLVIETEAGELRHHKPRLHQGEREIAGGFTLRGNQAGFRVGAYDHSQELTIDPLITFTGLLGGGPAPH
jgi:hypothetical protein